MKRTTPPFLTSCCGSGSQTRRTKLKKVLCSSTGWRSCSFHKDDAKFCENFKVQYSPALFILIPHKWNTVDNRAMAILKLEVLTKLRASPDIPIYKASLGPLQRAENRPSGLTFNLSETHQS